MQRYNEPGTYTLLLQPQVQNTKLPQLQLMATMYLGRENEDTLCIKLRGCDFSMMDVDPQPSHLCPFALDTAVFELGLRAGGNSVLVDLPASSPQLLSMIRIEDSYVKRYVTFLVNLAQCTVAFRGTQAACQGLAEAEAILSSTRMPNILNPCSCCLPLSGLSDFCLWQFLLEQNQNKIAMYFANGNNNCS